MSKKYAIYMRWKKNDYYMRTDGNFGNAVFSAEKELKLFNTMHEAQFVANSLDLQPNVEYMVSPFVPPEAVE